MGKTIGTTFKGIYQLVPPPGANVAGFGFRKIGRGLKKGVKKGAKGTYKVAKKTTAISAYAMKRLAKLAAKPIIAVVNKLANRRAKYVAFKRTGSTVLSKSDKKAGGQYALGKLAKAGPVGKLGVRIIKFTGGVTSGETSGEWNRVDADLCGMTGVEIATVAMKVVEKVKALTNALNKPGEAPANPESEAATPAAEEPAATPAAEEPATEEPTTEEPTTEEPTTEEADATEGESYDTVYFNKLRRKIRRY